MTILLLITSSFLMDKLWQLLVVGICNMNISDTFRERYIIPVLLLCYVG